MVTTEGTILSMITLGEVSKGLWFDAATEVACGVKPSSVLCSSAVLGVELQAIRLASKAIATASALPRRTPLVNCYTLSG